jgi:alkylation response protein AidB-like acyl-CoA dehydrogenase
MDLPLATAETPIFDPRGFRLSPFEAELTARAREFGARVLAPRAALWDREARFPMPNYEDMRREGWLGICVPVADGGWGADFRTYCLAAAEFGRHCGATALTWNMHVCSTLWTGLLTDDLEMNTAPAPPTTRGAARITATSSKAAPSSRSPSARAARRPPARSPSAPRRRRSKGGWRINGRKIFASLSGHADYYGILCTEVAEGGKPSRRDTLYLAIPRDAPGVAVEGEWDPLGMRGTVSRNLVFTDVFVGADAMLMPPTLYSRRRAAGRTCS